MTEKMLKHNEIILKYNEDYNTNIKIYFINTNQDFYLHKNKSINISLLNYNDQCPKDELNFIFGYLLGLADFNRKYLTIKYIILTILIIFSILSFLFSYLILFIYILLFIILFNLIFNHINIIYCDFYTCKLFKTKINSLNKKKELIYSVIDKTGNNKLQYYNKIYNGILYPSYDRRIKLINNFNLDYELNFFIILLFALRWW